MNGGMNEYVDRRTEGHGRGYLDGWINEKVNGWIGVQPEQDMDWWMERWIKFEG